MKVTVHQPNYMPYLGIFNKIKNSDIYVMYDVAQYVKDRFDNRNKIRTREGELWLTIPVLDKDSLYRRFYEVKLPPKDNWRKKHWKSIETYYCKADYFESYREDIRRIYDDEYSFLVEINERIIRFLLREFGITTKIIKTSELDLDSNLKSTEMLIGMLKKVDATTYLAGESGRKYMDESMFSDAHIRLEYQNFTHRTYKQVYEPFIPNMAAIDLLFNMGDKSYELI